MSNLGLTVGRYTLQRPLGAGPSGTLFLADAPDGQPLVIKKLGDDLVGDPEIADRLLQAVISARRLNHPQIVPIHELVEDRSQLYIVMPLVDGIHLGRLFTHLAERNAPLSVEQAAYITLQIAAGLAHAHNQPNPVLHGALWPQNVLIDREGQVRLTDFGAFLAPPEASRGEVSIRTRYAYRTPEHITGAPLSPRTDVFQLANLLYQMVVARPAFVGETLMQTVERLQSGKVSLEGVPVVLRGPLAAALKADPYARPATMTRLAQAIERGVAPSPMAAAQIAAMVEVLADPLEGEPAAASDKGADRCPPDELEEQTQVTREQAKPLEVLGSTEEHQPAVSTPARALDHAFDDPDDGPTQVGDEASVELEAGPTQVSAPMLDELETSSVTHALLDQQTEPSGEPGPDALFGSAGDGELDPADTQTETVVEKATAKNSARLPARGPSGRRPQLTGPLPELDYDDVPTGSTQLATGPLATGPLAEGRQTEGAPSSVSLRQIREIADEDQRDSDQLDGDDEIGTRRWSPADDDLDPPTPIEAEVPTYDIRSPRLRQDTPPPLGPPPASITGLDEAESSVSVSISGPGGISEVGSLSDVSGISFTGTAATFDDLYDSAVPSLDFEPPTASAPSVAPIPTIPRRRQLTPAHALLGVAILVFLFAVGLAIRRLVRRAASPTAGVAVASDAGTSEAGSAPDAKLARNQPPDAGKPTPPPDAGTPAKQPRPRRATLRVLSTPPGTVYIEGQPLGEAPLTVDLAKRWPGKRRLAVAIVASEHAVHRQQIRVKTRGTTTLKTKLTKVSYPRATSRRRGFLRVLCKPGDPRRLLLNRRDTGFSCPKVTFALWPGRYRLGFYDFRNGEKKHYWVRVRSRHKRLFRLSRLPR